MGDLRYPPGAVLSWRENGCTLCRTCRHGPRWPLRPRFQTSCGCSEATTSRSGLHRCGRRRRQPTDRCGVWRSVRVHRERCSYRLSIDEPAARERGTRVSTFAQYEQWSGGRWAYAGSVLEGFGVSAAADPPERPTLLVAMGTLAFPFPRLVDAVTRVTPDDWNLLWQTGPVEYAGLRGTVVGAASDREFKSLCQQADVIVGHAGVGTALASLSSGRMPVLVPRTKACGEHVDDHQRFIARELSSRGLAVEAAAETLSVADLHRALASAVHQIDPEGLPRLRVLPTRAAK